MSLLGTLYSLGLGENRLKQTTIAVYSEASWKGKIVVSYDKNKFDKATFQKINKYILSILFFFLKEEFFCIFLRQAHFQIRKESITVQLPGSCPIKIASKYTTQKVIDWATALFEIIGEDNYNYKDPYFSLQCSL